MLRKNKTGRRTIDAAKSRYACIAGRVALCSQQLRPAIRPPPFFGRLAAVAIRWGATVVFRQERSAAWRHRKVGAFRFARCAGPWVLIEHGAFPLERANWPVGLDARLARATLLGRPAAPNRHQAKLTHSKKMHISRACKYAGTPPEQEGGQIGARAGKDSCAGADARMGWGLLLRPLAYKAISPSPR